MAKIPGLHQRGNTWYLRLRVPKDVQPYIKKREVNRTLETQDRKVAARNIHAVRSNIEAEFEKIRQQVKAKAGNTDMLSGYSDNQLIALAGKWFNDIKTKQEVIRINDSGGCSEAKRSENHIELKQDEWAAREEVLGYSPEEMHDGRTIATEFLENEGVSFDRKSESFGKIGYFFSKAIHELAKQNLEEYEGKRSLLAIASPYTHSANATPQRTITMGDLVQEYLSDPKVKRGESVLRNYRILERAIKEVIGNETYAHEVTRGHCQAISSLMLGLPSNSTKKIKAQTLAEAVKIGKEKNMPPLSPATYNNYMQNLSAIMGYAEREMYIRQNPAKKLNIKDVVKKKDKRDSFTLEQLKKIFGSDIYHEHRKDALIYNPESKTPHLYGRYWIPLIDLWTGMRLNEVCQLYITDIDMIDNVPVILIRDTDEEDDETEKRVKTENGIRFVPIHPMLVRMGLLDFIKSVNKAGATRLFPDIKLDSRGYYSHYFSKRFSQHLKDIDAKTKKTSFHSLRHTYRDAIRVAKLSRDAISALGGWSPDSTDEQYGSGLGARDLYEELCKIEYAGLDLAHLYK